LLLLMEKQSQMAHEKKLTPTPFSLFLLLFLKVSIPYEAFHFFGNTRSERSLLRFSATSRSGRTTSAGLSAQVMVVRRDRYTEVLITYIRFDSLRHMDTRFELNGITFVWAKGKARSNWNKHGVSFEQAAEAFFDPLAKLINASTEEEARDALIGLDRQGRLLFVVHIEIKDPIRIISARKATRQERRGYED
jgi:uncharacterized protein